MPTVKKHIKYENVDLKKYDIPEGLNVSWMPNDECAIEGDSAKLNQIKTNLESNGAKITILADMPTTQQEQPRQPTAEEIAEQNRRQQAIQNARQSEIDRINAIIQAEYTKLGGTGTAPKINSWRDIA